MIIIYILAIIGGLCVLGMAFLALVIFLDCKRDTEKDAKEPEITCALTGEHCIFTVERSTCIGCPIAEEAERLSAISSLIPVMKQTAELVGFEVVGRIALRDKATGKEYR